MKRFKGLKPAWVLLVAIGALFAMSAAGAAHAQGYPPRNLKQYQVRPHVFTDGKILKPGTYNVWVRVGDYAPAPDVGSNSPTVFRGGSWTMYPNIDFSRGGKPRHVTTFPVATSFNFTEFNDPRYGTPGSNEFILHLDNRSVEQTVTYVFQRTKAGWSSDAPASGSGPTGAATINRGSSPFDGLWHTHRVHTDGHSYSADDDLVFSTDAKGITTIRGAVFPGTGKVSGNTYTFTYGPRETGSFTLGADGRSFSGSFSDLTNKHSGTVQGRR